nr:hypothetical protein [Cytophagales bacterium]
MELEEIISHQRQTYLKQLGLFYDKRTEGAKEILMALNSQEEGLLFKLSRLDYLIKLDGEFKIEELSPDTYSNHSQIDFQLGQLTIELNPFFWHGCEFAIDKEYENIDWLRNWTKKWIDEEDEMPTDENGFCGAIHSVSYPTFENHITRFTVDFGTVSVDAFMELIEEINVTGANKIIINSFDLID